MAGEPEKDKKDIGEMAGDLAPTATTTEEKKKKKKRGMLSRIWNGFFRLHGDDFEKRLQYISKEEATVLSRMKKRTLNWRRMTRHLIIFSVLFELIAVGYAIVTTRSLDLNWKMRALRVLPMFLLPCLSAITYSALVSFTKMRDRRDQKTLERLRAERQEKINELKEKTNYYTTQQLIQRYDPDPAAKAAAATVLASKLGADSGMRVYMGDDSKLSPTMGKSSDVELVQSSGLRKRKPLETRSSCPEGILLHPSEEETLHRAGTESPEISQNNQLVVEHHSQTATANDGGWFARIAALLVGEDPTQSYALICGNCHMHNGLARTEDFPYITYYCPHCNALNRPKQLEDSASSSISPNLSASSTVDEVTMSKNIVVSSSERIPINSGAVAAAVENTEGSKTTVAADPVS